MNKKIKQCPYFQADCLKEDCGIYNEKLDRCEVGLLTYNLFILSKVEKDRLNLLLENEGAQSNSRKGRGGSF